MRILIVDDDDNYLEVLKIYLESEGHSCISANTQKKALSIIKGIKFDVVLLDLVMDNEDTIDLLCQIKSTNTRIILVSAALRIKSVAKDNKVDFLSKPFNFEDLEKLLTPPNKSYINPNEQSIKVVPKQKEKK